MDKGSSDERSYAAETAVKTAYIKSTATFFTALVTAAVLITGLIVAAHLYGLGGTGGGQAMGTSSVSMTAAQTSEKMMDSDMSMEIGLMTGDGEMMMERISYDYDSNVILIDTPGSFYKNNSAATFAFDMDRSVVFAALHEENECIAFKISSMMASELKSYLEPIEDNVVEVSTLPFDLTDYEDVGVVPDDYIKTTNGAIIRGLCAGKPTTWAMPTALSPRGGAARRKRGCSFKLACCCRRFRCHCNWVLRCSGSI